MMLPPNLTTYLVALADLLGYDLDLAELEPVTGLCTEWVIAWAEAGTRHATIAYMRTLLAAPISFLRSSPSDCEADQHRLASLLDRDQRYDEALDDASRRYAAACHALLGTGLVWPRPSEPTPPPNDLDPPAAVDMFSRAEPQESRTARQGIA